MRILIFASSEFSIPLLETIYKSDHEILAVYTQPPSISGRGKKLNHSPIGIKCKELNLKLFHPFNVNEKTEIRKLLSMKIDIAIVSAYGQLLSTEILQLPRFGFLNLHPSLLPRWRGAAPIERAIIEGDKITGVCTIRMVKELDAGPILSTERIELSLDETNTSLSDKLSRLGAIQMLKVINNLKAYSESPQDNHGITYASKIKKSETRINWNLSGREVDRLIRGLSEKPGAWSTIDGIRVKILKSKFVKLKGKVGHSIIPPENSAPLLIACSEGAVEIQTLQKEGKKPISSYEFVRGYRSEVIIFE